MIGWSAMGRGASSASAHPHGHTDAAAKTAQAIIFFEDLK
jgi:hypothetical protein